MNLVLLVYVKIFSVLTLACIVWASCCVLYRVRKEKEE